MNTAPCFVDGVTVMTGRSCSAAQQSSRHRVFNAVAAAAGVTGVDGITAASSPQSWACGSGAFVMFLGIGIGADANRHRCRRSRNTRGGRTSSLQACLTVNMTTEADNTIYDYALQGTSEVCLPVCKPRSDDPALSLTAYMTQPVGAFTLIPLPHGVSLNRVGLKRAANGCDEEYFCVQLPPIKFPGLFSLDAVVNTFLKAGDQEMVIEGNEMKLMGGLDDLDAVNESMLFFKNSSFTWTDEPDKRELRMKTEVQLKLAPPKFLRSLVPKFIFKPMGKAAMKIVLHIVQNSLAGAFAKDYMRWETDEEFRTARFNALPDVSV